MKQLAQKYFSTKWPALIWSAIVFVLLAMPSRSFQFPNERLFVIPHFDKFVHAAVFLVIVILWAFYFATKTSTVKFSSVILITAVLVTVYGMALEYVQLFVGRDFDVWDMVADGTGATLGWLYNIKKISPGRNRGRNQN